MFPAGSFLISLPAHLFLSSAHTWSHCHTHQCLAQRSGSAGTVSCGASLCKGSSCLIFAAFSPPARDIKSNIVQIRILTWLHNHKYKTCFPSGIDGRETGWKWSSLTRRLRRQWQIWLLCNELQGKPLQRPIWRWHNLNLPFIAASCVHGWDPSWESAKTDESNQHCFLYASHTNKLYYIYEIGSHLQLENAVVIWSFCLLHIL